MTKNENSSPFVRYTSSDAPEASKPMVQGTEKKFGFLPGPVSVMAESPELLATFTQCVGTFDKTTLAPMEREVLIQTLATHVECHYCVAMHSAMLTRMEAPAALVEALREKRALSDQRLDAMRKFTMHVIEQHGEVDEADLKAFLAAGYTTRNALEVVLGIGIYTMSTFANRLTRVDLDPPFQAFAWMPFSKRSS